MTLYSRLIRALPADISYLKEIYRNSSGRMGRDVGQPYHRTSLEVRRAVDEGRGAW